MQRHRADRAEATAKEIAERGGSAVPETSSVATPAGGAAIVDTAIQTFGSVDIVVNNAGQLLNAAFDDLPVEHFQPVLDTHLAGSFYVTQPAYRHMKTAGHGRIIFTSSSAGAFAALEQANYSAAKAGVIGLCHVVAIEGAPHGIVANAILPWALDTRMGDEGPPPYSPDALRRMSKALAPFARYMVAENVAPMVVYLASRRCTETGHVFSTGAGHIARVFMGVTRGWYAPGLANMTPEHIEANFAAVSDLEKFAVPESVYDECRYITENMPSTDDGH